MDDEEPIDDQNDGGKIDDDDDDDDDDVRYRLPTDAEKYQINKLISLSRLIKK